MTPPAVGSSLRPARCSSRRVTARPTIEDIIAAARVSRATLYLHFDSKLDLLHAAAEKMAAESNDAARRLAVVLVDGDRAELRAWVEWALKYYVRNRPMALAAQEAELARTSRPRDCGLSGVRRAVGGHVALGPANRSPDEVRAVPPPNAPLHVGHLARPIR